MIKTLTFTIVGILSLFLVLALSLFFIKLTPRDRVGLTEKYATLKQYDVTRKYRVYQPHNIDGAQPLVVALHGLSHSGRSLELYSGLSNLAEEEGFLVAYPEGRFHSWNAGFCCGFSYLQQSDDIRFIKSMVEDIKANYPVDEDRIYIVGFSNGGALAQLLLEKAPGTFAAGASLMSGIGTDSYEIQLEQASAPIMLINGSRDIYTPNEPERTERFTFLPPQATAQKWAEHYEADKVSTYEKLDFSSSTYENDQGVKILSRLYNTNHQWPQWRLWDFDESVPASTRDIWNFLRSYSF